MKIWKRDIRMLRLIGQRIDEGFLNAFFELVMAMMDSQRVDIAKLEAELARRDTELKELEELMGHMMIADDDDEDVPKTGLPN